MSKSFNMAGGGASVEIVALQATENRTYTAAEGQAYNPVDVNVQGAEVLPLSVTANGTYDAPEGQAYDPVVVNVQNLEVLPLSVTENGTYTPSEGQAYGPVSVSVTARCPRAEPETAFDLAGMIYTGKISWTVTAVQE